MFATGGDGFAVAFARAADAAAAATAVQTLLSEEKWAEDATVRVRIALHTGEAVSAAATTSAPRSMKQPA